MFEAAVLVSIICYIGFRNWLNHDKRRMVHKERLAAIEKGIQFPAVELEVERKSWTVQRFLLLAGWSWVFIGVGGFIALSIMVSDAWPALAHESGPTKGLPYITLIPFGIGVAHLITYWVGERRGK